MSPGEAVRRMLAAILPWPTRAERKQAIVRARARADAARRNAEQAEVRAARARELAERVQRLAYDDPAAAVIARQIRDRR